MQPAERRRPRWGLDLAEGGRRAARTLPATVQIAVAVVAAYAISHYLLGHPFPVIAATVTITSLGLQRDARPARVAETALGMLVGIVLSETILLVAGAGIWQLLLSVLVAVTVGRVLSGSPGFAVAAATQAALIQVLPIPAGGPFTRSLDGLVAGAVALVVTALLPRDPARGVVRLGGRLSGDLSGALALLVAALRLDDQDPADRALERLRRTQPVLDEWASMLDSAIGVARISPLLRRRRPELQRQRAVLAAMDLAVRNARVVARRVQYLVGDGRPRAELADLFSAVENAAALVGRTVAEPELAAVTRQSLTVLAVRLHPSIVLADATIAESALVLTVRPLVVDLLVAAGTERGIARGMLPAVA